MTITKGALLAAASLTLTQAALAHVLVGQATARQQIEEGHIAVEGDKSAVIELMELLDFFDFWFEIVMP